MRQDRVAVPPITQERLSLTSRQFAGVRSRHTAAAASNQVSETTSPFSFPSRVPGGVVLDGREKVKVQGTPAFRHGDDAFIADGGLSCASM